jgi:hypothetical protein
MMDGFRFPRFDPEDFMMSVRGRFQIGILAASRATVNRCKPADAQKRHS